MTSFVENQTVKNMGLIALWVGVSFVLMACAGEDDRRSKSFDPNTVIPGEKFDLNHWKLTLPQDLDDNGRADNIGVQKLQTYSHANFFYLDDKGDMVFTSPNKGAKTRTSANTRSELRYMLAGSDSSINEHAPGNNFALASRSDADEFASIGGKMEATLHIDHTPLRANRPNDSSTYALVVGQIHAIDYRSKIDTGFGYGNEPLKIFYKKWPRHETGSVYWNYERNLPRDDDNRKDISYQVWGNARTDPDDPGEDGIALGEDFSYTVNVYKDTMFLTFENPRLGKVRHEINLTDNIDADGEVDSADNPRGYTEDGHYFKAGVYNQCRAGVQEGEAIPRCNGTGDWIYDKPNGDYGQVSFSRLVVSRADRK